ncbi:MAG: hypothetical protein GQ470_05320, partial [Gammaproteobacteria bacterium]|nr:hypothetical protein [Gammaproteobacteria bacterium]
MPPSKEKSLSSKEKLLFQDAVDGVNPLEQKRVPPFRQKPIARLLHSQQAELQNRDDLFSDGIEPSHLAHDNEISETKEQLFFHRSGLQRATLKKLRRCQIRVEAELDLHGFTVAEA